MAELEVFTADTAGNVTIFVCTPVERACYRAVAERLLKMKSLKGEQVAFIKEEDIESDFIKGRAEMCGMEFCGNASRAFGFYLLEKEGYIGKAEAFVNMSGCAETLKVECDLREKTAGVKMPLPLKITKIDEGKVLVAMEGILHMIHVGGDGNPLDFMREKNELMTKYDPEALGVMYFDPAQCYMVPAVYVRDVDSVYFEGSCGSGTTALAAVLAEKEQCGVFSYDVKQPGGVLTAVLYKEEKKIKAIQIEGSVVLSEKIRIDF